MLARHDMDRNAELAQHLLRQIELLGRGEVSDVAGVDDKIGPDRQRLRLGDHLLQRAERIRVGRLVEAEMGVADLQEAEAGFRRGA